MQILDLAHSYYSAAEVLADAGANAIPIINLRCHAIELFLKALHQKDTFTDTGTGVFVMRPGSGRNVSHDLNDSFLKALPAHRDELLREMSTLCDDLKKLYGVFAKSRYLYEAGGSLPHSKAKNVSQLLAEKTANLPRYPSS